MTDLEVAPHWTITSASAPDADLPSRIVILPGPGFGSGAHETTQMCLLAVRAFAPRGRAWRLLDFGCGSGILSIAGVKLGGASVAVEIDLAAQAHARANAGANRAGDRIEILTTLDQVPGVFDIVVANVLRDVLIASAGDLVRRLAPAGTLVLSGLVSTDVPAMIAHYSSHFGGARGASRCSPIVREGRRPDIYERGEWRALVWRLAG